MQINIRRCGTGFEQEPPASTVVNLRKRPLSHYFWPSLNHGRFVSDHRFPIISFPNAIFRCSYLLVYVDGNPALPHLLAAPLISPIGPACSCEPLGYLNKGEISFPQSRINRKHGRDTDLRVFLCFEECSTCINTKYIGAL